MNFSLGGVTRGFLVIMATLLLSVSLSACSNDASPLDTKAKATAAPDPKAVDTAAVKDVYTRFWAAKADAENNADPDPERFADILKGPVGEHYLKLVRDYKSQQVTRVGQAVITELNVNLDGDSATVVACVDEDDWRFKQDGKLIKQPKLGPKPDTAEVERSENAWFITETPEPSKTAKC